MKKARNFWRDLPQGGRHQRSVLTRLLLFVCMLAYAQAGWANGTITAAASTDLGDGHTPRYVVEVAGVGRLMKNKTGNQEWTLSSGKLQTGSSLFALQTYNAISAITIHGTGTGNNRTFSKLEVGTNTSNYAEVSATGSGTLSKNVEGTITISPNSTIAANSYVAITLSGNINIISVELVYASSGPTAPTFSPVSGTTVSGSQTITINGPSGSTIYYAWATSAQDAAAIYNSGSGSHGTADAGTATPTVESGKTLYAIARKNDTNSTVASASYTIDSTAPTLSSANPANGATGVATNGTIVLTFNEAIASVDATKFSLSSGSKDGVAIDGSDNTKVNITYSGMANNTAITLYTDAEAVADAAGNKSAALSDITFTTLAATTHSVTHNLTNVTATSGSTGASAATEGSAYNAVFAANSGYQLPSTIDVTIGGSAATAGTDYTWDSSTGALSIPAAKVTGNIAITVTGTEASGSSTKYTLAWDSNGGGSLSGSYSNGEIEAGAAITKPNNPTKNYYTFGGWFTNNDGTGDEAGSTMPGANTTYYAKWTQTVTLDANTSHNGSGPNTTASATWNGTSLTGFTQTTPKTGYKLVGFYTNNSSGTKVLNADGSFASNSVSGWITNGKWSRTSSTTTLYAHYEEDGVAIATAPTFDIRNGASNLEETSTRTYTIKDKTVLVKWRLNVQGYTYVRYTYGTTMPDDPTLTNGFVQDNTGNSGVSNTSGIQFQNTDTYYIKVVAWNKNKDPESSTGVILYTFTTSTEPKVTFTSPTTTVEVGKTVTNVATLTNASGTTITYSSSDTSVATVDNTGKVTGVAAGTTTITATYTENSTNYTDSYVMTVPESYTITKASPTGGSFTVKVGGSEVTSATAGTMVTITTTPNPGKEVDAITLSPSGSATKASENNYTFTMPASAVTVTVTFKDAAVSGLTPVTDYTWAVDQSAWDSYTTSSEIKANTIVGNIEVIANDGHSVQFGSQQKTFTDGSYTKFWKLGSPGSEYRLLHFKVAGRCKISAYVYQGSNRTVEIRKGGYNGTVIAETDISSSTPTIVSGDYTDNTEADIYVYSKKNELGVYAIKVEPLAAEVSAPTITQNGGDTYTGTASSKSITIATTAGSGTTYYVLSTAAATSGAAIFDNASKQVATGSAETIDLSSFATNESNVVVSAVTKDGDNYSDIVTATYTYAGLRSFEVRAADKTLQKGGRDNVDPAIYYKDGTLFDVSEDEHDLSYYFTFTYSKTGEANVTVGENTGIINVSSDAIKDQTATITITATPTAEGKAIFKDETNTGTMTVTVKEKESGTKMSFYWDPECTEANKVQDTEWGEGEGKRSVFTNPYENGRMIYVKPDPGYEIWVATVSSETANNSGLTTPTASIGKYDDTHYSTTHGIPLYISGMSDGEERTLVIGLKAYKAGTTEGVGSAASARFRIVQTENGQAKRPDAPTFSPTKSEAGTLSTAQTVAAVGDPGSYVFSKFGSSTLGLGYFINYLEGTQAGREQVATFSTEIGDRDIKALQITGSGNEYYISEYGSVNDYMYNLASKLLVTPATYYVNVGDAFTTPALTKITTDQAEEPSASNYSSPTLTGYFYNKQKAEANAAPYQGLKFEEPAGTSLLSYSIENFNGAEASIDPSTGVVAIGNKSGYAIVTVNYAGGENYTIKTKKIKDARNTTTSKMTATYRINIVDPNEYLPIINPTSRKFANSLDVTISVPDENHYVKYVVANGEEVKTAEQVKAAGETINKNSRVTVTVGENINVGDKVSVYAIAYDDNGVTSTVVKETYTKVTPLQKPTLSPDGVTKPYEFTKSELAVAAVAYNAGAVIYYTTDGSDPTKAGAKTYDGASKILVEKEDGTTIVKAAAYLDGIYSDVVTGTYVPTDDLAKPWFLVNGIKVEDTEKTISTTDVITISNGREEDGSVYYYTLDGTAPTTTEGQAYNPAGFTLVKTVTASAIATENGLISPATTVTFIINDEGSTKHSFWEAIDETTPKGTMAANDRKVSEAKHTDSEGTSSYIYVKHLTATFGGFDNNAWNKTSIGENTQGAAMDGVGKYSIRNIMDVKEETDEDYDPTNMLIESVHGRTHALPSQGAYVKFEPEKDGVLTIWALQQGGLHYSADGDFCSRFIRFRPVFMVDETGKSIAATKAESTACLSNNWSDVESDNWLPQNSGDQNGDKNLYYDDDQNDAIYKMYTDWMTTGQSISVGGNIKPFEAPASIYPTLFGTGSYNDVHGYVMPSGGNVKYTFNVQAGKTYFFFGFRTKLGIRGFKFEPTSTSLGEAVTLPQTTDATTFISTNKGKTKNVTLSRKMKAGIWTTFCLPFSVSATQMENIFGKGVQVMQFDKVDGTTINLFKHYHRMIVAGTPIMVKPKTPMDNITFTGVHIEDIPAETINDDSGVGGYEFVGSYTPIDVTKDSYYMGANDGKWYRLTADKATLNGTRAFLHLIPGNSAKSLSYRIASIYDEEDEDVTTGIIAIENDGGNLNGITENGVGFDNNVYNTQGQIVRRNATSIEGLPKGIYIVNGKKVSVK